LGVGLSFASLSTSDLSKETLESRYTNEASRFVQIDGNRVHYRDEGSGPAIVLLHGTASSLHTWDTWAEQLQGSFRIVRMDLPGFGLTGPDRLDRYEVSDDVRFLSDFLNTLNIEEAHLVGSSLGGRIAWQYALEHPSQVKTLTLLNALGYQQESWPPAIELAQWPVIDQIMEHVSPRFMYEIGLKEVYFDASIVTDEVVDRYYELSRYPGNLSAFTRRVKARLDQDEKHIANLTLPTLILWGKEDIYFPVESGLKFSKDISKSELKIYAGIGHLPMEEAPNKSANDVSLFISQHEAILKDTLSDAPKSR
jgi:pimeloyl-ACP methyl ester carboxylesterase